MPPPRTTFHYGADIPTFSTLRRRYIEHTTLLNSTGGDERSWVPPHRIARSVLTETEKLVAVPSRIQRPPSPRRLPPRRSSLDPRRRQDPINTEQNDLTIRTPHHTLRLPLEDVMRHAATSRTPSISSKTSSSSSSTSTSTNTAKSP